MLHVIMSSCYHVIMSPPGFTSACRHRSPVILRPRGLVLGITTTPPAALAQTAPEGFEAADDVPNSWSFGAAVRTGDV